MDFSLSEEQTILRDTTRKFLTQACPPDFVKEMLADEKGYSPTVWNQMAELGWMGLPFEEKYGGFDATFLDLAIILEEMGRVLLPGPFFATVILGGMAISEGASEALKERLLPPIAEGKSIMTMALTEGEGSYNPQGVETTATSRPEGFSISGEKTFVPDAHLADSLICPARGPSEGLSLFVMPTAADGITITPLKTLHHQKQAQVSLSQVAVSQDHLIGEPGEGLSLLSALWPKMVVARSCEMLGAMERAFEMTVRYSQERRQFGLPLSGFQVIQHYLADMAIELEAARFLTHQAAWTISEGLAAQKEGAAAKAYATDSLKHITTTAQQIHGGIGFTEEHDLHLYFRCAKAWEASFGDASFHRETVAREIGL
jgi:alkylation response protein AidB-like acyl-CoA dehydrogenase